MLSEKCAIETTYRFGNPTIDISSQFIMENSAQVPKEIKPMNESVRTEIKTVAYYTDDAGDSQYEVLERLFPRFHQSNLSCLLDVIIAMPSSYLMNL